MTGRTWSSPVCVSLSLLLLCASGSSAQAQPPFRVVFAESPAFLIQIDGDPVYRRIAGTALERVVNTDAVIVRGAADIHYLKVRGGWMVAYGLMGRWSVSGVSPFSDSVALDGTLGASPVDLLGDPAEWSARHQLLDADPPTVIISTGPAALIVTDGPAHYQIIEGTSLARLVNTTATVFREPTDQQLYVRVAQGWFQSWRTDGPWQRIASDKLPADIAAYVAHRIDDQR